MLFILDEVQTASASPGRCGRSRASASRRTSSRSARRPGLRLRLERQDPRGEGERLHGLLAHQLDLGREPRRHGALPEEPRDHGGGEARREREDDGRFPARQAEELAREFPGKMTNVRARPLLAFDLPDGPTRGKVLASWLRKHNVMSLPSGEPRSASAAAHAREGRGRARRPALRATSRRSSAEEKKRERKRRKEKKKFY